MHSPRLLLPVVATHTGFATETKTPAHLTKYEHAAWTSPTNGQCFLVNGKHFGAETMQIHTLPYGPEQLRTK